MASAQPVPEGDLQPEFPEAGEVDHALCEARYRPTPEAGRPGVPAEAVMQRAGSWRCGPRRPMPAPLNSRRPLAGIRRHPLEHFRRRACAHHEGVGGAARKRRCCSAVLTSCPPSRRQPWSTELNQSRPCRLCCSTRGSMRPTNAEEDGRSRAVCPEQDMTRSNMGRRHRAGCRGRRPVAHLHVDVEVVSAPGRHLAPIQGPWSGGGDAADWCAQQLVHAVVVQEVQ